MCARKIENALRKRIERVMEITDLSFDHPDFDDSTDDDYSELFFTVGGGHGVHGDLPEPWMKEMNGYTLDDCEKELISRGYVLEKEGSEG